jgi:hypothetical protein
MKITEGAQQRWASVRQREGTCHGIDDAKGGGGNVGQGARGGREGGALGAGDGVDLGGEGGAAATMRGVVCSRAG